MEMEYAKKIVKASGIQSGERVLVHFWGEDGQKGLINSFMAAVAAQGATPIYLQQARSVNREIFANAGDKCFPESYFENLSGFDTVLDLFAYQPIILGYPLEEKQMKLYRRYISKLFGALMTAKRFLQIRLPTGENAEESGLAPEDYIARMEAAYGVDYDAMRREGVARIGELSRFDQYVLHTGEGHQLRFDLTGRQWNLDAGDGDWPCGEVYIAPLEEKTEGSVFFPKLYLKDDGVFENVVLYVCEGRLTDSSHPEVRAFLERLDAESRVVCELGLGLNPGVRDLCGYTVLDEKLKGSFHFAIGANQMFGGANKAKIHLDMVNDGWFTLEPKEVTT